MNKVIIEFPTRQDEVNGFYELLSNYKHILYGGNPHLFLVEYTSLSILNDKKIPYKIVYTYDYKNDKVILKECKHNILYKCLKFLVKKIKLNYPRSIKFVMECRSAITCRMRKKKTV
jgi:hypothetical protein